MKHEEYKEMLELAALDALVGDDVRALDAHISTCDECRAELAELRDAAAMLLFYAEPVAPSAELNARILDISRTTPRVARTPSPEMSESVGEGESKGGGKTSAPSVFVPQQRTWRRRWSRSSHLGAAAAALIVLVLIVAFIVLWNRDRATQAELARLSSRNEEMRADLERLARRNDELQAELARTSKHNDELQAELARFPNRKNQRPGEANPREPGAPPTVPEKDSRVVEMTATSVAPRARARLSYNRRTGVIELTVSDMPPLPAGKTYQLWLLIGGSPVSAGTFSTGPGGRAMLHGQLAADALEASAFAVTLEPAGGSNKPTGPKYLLGSAL